jgi:HPt (histidine-containing phosphotransfer) domain-containing protein
VNVPGQTATPDRLVSDLLVDDPEMRDLVEEFVDGLTERVVEFRQAYEQLDWDQLAKLAHQLKGAGGSYGYPDLSQLGASMESEFRAHSADEFPTRMTRLENLINAACKGLQEL